MNEKERMLQAIEELQRQREEAHIIPCHVRCAEIISRTGIHQPFQSINELVKDGKIAWCRTINDVAFTIKKNNNQKQ